MMTAPQIARRLLESGGIVGIKVGQYLALRRDWLPGPTCDELAQLQGRAQPFPGGRAHVERELGCPIARVFATFEDTPRAAASTGQVHRATLRSGQPVAVKIQRPGLARSVNRGLWTLRVLMAPFRLVLWRWRLGEALAQLTQMLLEEQDYRYEISHQRAMRGQLRHHPGIRVPRVYSRYCTAKLTVTAWVSGPTLADVVLGAVPPPRGFDGERVATTAGLSWFRQMFEGARIHADPNQANLILRSKSRLWLLDFGSVTMPDRELMDRFRLFLLSLAARNYSRAAEEFCLMCRNMQKLDHGKLKADIVGVLERWTIRATSRTLDYVQKSMNNLTEALMAVVQAAGGALQWSWLRLSRALSILDAAFAKIAPRMNYIRLVTRYLAEMRQRAPLPTWTDLVLAARHGLEILERGHEYLQLDTQLLRFNGLLKEI